ncbi:heat shock protein 70 family, partial [Baffinella frigidus]
PTAAGIAYGLERPGSSGHVLVYDLGGGTCDLTLLKVEDGVFEVKGAGGDTNFGGNDLDKLLLGERERESEREGGRERERERALRRFLAKCEQAKRVLSTTAQTTIEIDQVYGGVDFYTNITRSTFENLCEKFLRSTLDALERLLREAKLSKNQIDKVVLAGGSTRIP